MIYNKRREWMTFVNPKLHKMYDEIRSELMESVNDENIMRLKVKGENNE